MLFRGAYDNDDLALITLFPICVCRPTGPLITGSGAMSSAKAGLMDDNNNVPITIFLHLYIPLFIILCIYYNILSYLFDIFDK